MFFPDQTHSANAHYILSRTILHFDCVYISHRVAGYHKYLPWRFWLYTKKEGEGVIKSVLIELFRWSLFLFRRNKNETHWEFLLVLMRKKLIKNSMVPSENSQALQFILWMRVKNSIIIVAVGTGKHASIRDKNQREEKKRPYSMPSNEFSPHVPMASVIMCMRFLRSCKVTNHKSYC